MTSDADLVADALRHADSDPTLNGKFRATALRRFPVDLSAELLRQETADALALPAGRLRSQLRDRIVDHLFVTEGRDCVTGDVVLTDGTILHGGASARFIALNDPDRLEP